MQSSSFGRVVWLAALSSVLALSACGGDDKPPPIDLLTDQNRDEIPDELHKAVQDALKIADAGTPGVLDPEEETAFFTAINNIGERLPFQEQTIRRLERMDALTKEIQSAQTEEAQTDLLIEAGELDAQLQDDPNYKLFSEALDKMPELTPTPEAATLRATTKATGSNGFDQLQRGDVMLIHSGGIGYAFPWAWHFTHAGNYDGSNMVYESVGDGVLAQSIEGWKGKKRYAFGRSKNKSTESVVQQLNLAKAKYGTDGRTKYNFNFPNKQTDEKLYCSQLVWKIHRGTGVDIDSNSVKWFLKIALKASPALAWNPPLALAASGVLIGTVLRPAVAPDEIYYSDQIKFYFDK